VLPPTVRVPPESLSIKLKKVCVAAVPPMVWEAVVLENVTVFGPAPGVNVAPLFVQLPWAVMLAAAVKVPAVSVVLPLITSVAGAVKLPEVSVKSWVVRDVVLPPTDNVCPDVRLSTTLLKV